MPSFGEQLPLRDGRWYILFDVGAGAGTSAAAEAIGETGTGVTTAFDAEPSAEPAGAEPGAGAGPGAAPPAGHGLMAAAYYPPRLSDLTAQPVDARAKQD